MGGLTHASSCPSASESAWVLYVAKLLEKAAYSVFPTRAAERSAHCAVISLFIGRKSANTRVSTHVAPVRDSTAICPLASGRSSSAYAPFSPGRSSAFAASGMNRGGQAAEICSAERTSAQSPAVSRRRTRKSAETASTVPSAQESREAASGASRASSASAG